MTRQMSLPIQAALLVAVLAIATALSLALGAANLGVALGIGQIAFTIVLVWLLLRQ